MRGRKAVFIIALLLGGCASGGSGPDPGRQALIDESLREFCRTQTAPPCREDVSFTLVVDAAGRTETFAFPLLPPPLQNGYLSVLPGETLYLTGEFENDVLTQPRAALQPFATPQLAFKLTQRDGQPGMLFTVKNDFDKPVKYKLAMMRADSEQLLKTSSCPVIAGGSGFEMWPHAVFQLIVLEVRALAEGAGMICEW